MRLPAGFYYNDVKRYLEIFGRKQVKIIIFEEWIKNPKETIKEILQFLGINHSLDNFRPEVYNQFVGPRGKFSQRLLKSKPISKIAKRILPLSTRTSFKEQVLKTRSKPKINKKGIEILSKYYKADVLKLNSLFGSKLPWPNFQNNL